MIAKVPEGELFSAGRLSKPMSTVLREHNEAPRLSWERKHLSAILQVDTAHIIMLAEQNLIDKTQAGAILGELDELKLMDPSALPIEPGHGSMVLQIEKILAERLGADIAGNMPIARSRLDQGATVRRIADRKNVLNVMYGVIDLRETLSAAAEKHREMPVISYTHLQQAQPADFGHYLLAFGDRLSDSLKQLTEVYSRINRSPLGAVGLSGTDLRTDRHRTAALLGFDKVLENSRLGRDAYYQLEVALALAMIMTVMNDLCSDLHVFSSTEFGTVELDDSHCSTSSIFPQKKNPYGLETIKGKAAESHGWIAAALAAFRNEGSIDTAARSFGNLENACQTTVNMMTLMMEVVEGLTVHRDRSEELLGKAWVTTNRLANVLMSKHGLSYRSAHSVVARLVKNCLDKGIPKAGVTVVMLRQAGLEMQSKAIDMSQVELNEALDHKEYLRNCVSFGGVGPEEVFRLLHLSKTQIRNDRQSLDEKIAGLEEANKQLEGAARDVVANETVRL